MGLFSKKQTPVDIGIRALSEPDYDLWGDLRQFKNAMDAAFVADTITLGLITARDMGKLDEFAVNGYNKAWRKAVEKKCGKNPMLIVNKLQSNDDYGIACAVRAHMLMMYFLNDEEQTYQTLCDFVFATSLYQECVDMLQNTSLPDWLRVPFERCVEGGELNTNYYQQLEAEFLRPWLERK